jgi:DNA mismatch repair protein MutS
LVDYLQTTQLGRLPRLAAPRRLASGAVMEIDAATRRNLELTRGLTGDRQGSLLAAIDRTVSAGGARRLADWLAAPLTDPAAIDARLDMLAPSSPSPGCARICATPCGAPDIERSLLAPPHRPRGPAIWRRLASASPPGRCAVASPRRSARGAAPGGSSARRSWRPRRRLGRALGPAAGDRAGRRLHRPGYRDGLDELRSLATRAGAWCSSWSSAIAGRPASPPSRSATTMCWAITSRSTAIHLEKLTKSAGFIHRQTMANATRFTTVELGELERRIATAADKAWPWSSNASPSWWRSQAPPPRAIAAAAALALLDVAAALPSSPSRATCRPMVDGVPPSRSRPGAIPWWRRRFAPAGGRLRRHDCDLGAASGSGC